MFLPSVSSRIPSRVTLAASRLLFCHPTQEFQVAPVFMQPTATEDVGVTKSGAMPQAWGVSIALLKTLSCFPFALPFCLKMLYFYQTKHLPPQFCQHQPEFPRAPVHRRHTAAGGILLGVNPTATPKEASQGIA